MTNFNFAQIFDLPIMEFLTYVAYIRFKVKKEEQRLREFKIKHKLL